MVKPYGQINYTCQECFKKNHLKKDSGCPKCGSNAFYAKQATIVDIIVDENNNFSQTVGEEGDFYREVFDPETPVGPYQCVECGELYKELPKIGS